MAAQNRWFCTDFYAIAMLHKRNKILASGGLVWLLHTDLHSIFVDYYYQGLPAVFSTATM